MDIAEGTIVRSVETAMRCVSSIIRSSFTHDQLCAWVYDHVSNPLSATWSIYGLSKFAPYLLPLLQSYFYDIPESLNDHMRVMNERNVIMTLRPEAKPRLLETLHDANIAVASARDLESEITCILNSEESVKAQMMTCRDSVVRVVRTLPIPEGCPFGIIRKQRATACVSISEDGKTVDVTTYVCVGERVLVRQT